MTTRLILVRHAHADWSPDENRPLSRRGHRDAARLCDALAGFRPVRLFSSPYVRARETIEPLAARASLEVQIEPDLRERALAGGPVDDFWSAVEATWKDFDFAHVGGESNRVAQSRVARAVARIATDNADGPVILSTHGNAMALYLNLLDPTIDFAFWSALHMPDAFIVLASSGAAPTFKRLDF